MNLQQDLPTATSNTMGFDLSGIDIVLDAEDSSLDVVLDPRTLKLVGSLHRRFWEKRRVMLQKRALDGTAAPTAEANATTSGEVVADLRCQDSTFEDRIGEFLSLHGTLAHDSVLALPAIVRVRGWTETESGILVDGRAVPGCIIDVVVAMSTGADLMRDGTSAFVIEIPEILDDVESKLWSDLITLAEDRLGIPRRTVSVVEVCESDYEVDELMDAGEFDELAVA